MIRVGIPKGRLQEHIPDEIRCQWNMPEDRCLRWNSDGRQFFLLRSKVIPGLVAHRLLDMGYCGEDTLEEFLMPELLDVRPLGPQPGVRMIVAAADQKILHRPMLRPLIVGTSYPRRASRYLAKHGRAHIVVEQPGCTEGLCPDLVDLILDVAETGDTLAANGLHILEELGPVGLVEIRRKV